MEFNRFPVIDPVATGKNIVRLRKARGLTVRDLQEYFGFEAPQAIYKWQRGQSLPTVDNLFALSALLGVSIEDILVSASLHVLNKEKPGQQTAVCCPDLFFRLFWIRQAIGGSSDHFSLFRGLPRRCRSVCRGGRETYFQDKWFLVKQRDGRHSGRSTCGSVMAYGR